MNWHREAFEEAAEVHCEETSDASPLPRADEPDKTTNSGSREDRNLVRLFSGGFETTVHRFDLSDSAALPAMWDKLRGFVSELEVIIEGMGSLIELLQNKELPEEERLAMKIAYDSFGPLMRKVMGTW